MSYRWVDSHTLTAMSTIHPPIPVKLFIGMISNDPGLFDAAAKPLLVEYGPADLRSEPVPWEHTEYYRDEMGTDLLRCFLFFERLVDPATLVSTKQFTNRLEEEFSTDSGGLRNRRINLDPGYITEAKVVLASAKDFAHRVYLCEGIYAEVTLQFHGTSYHPIETTYPDFRTPQVRALFSKARKSLRAALQRSR
ncbi:MAG TPA: DUF4416 family protein [Nitrospirota bacterium]|nr:DUF4416 family protein [Nitrospirota bacterium]